MNPFSILRKKHDPANDGTCALLLLFGTPIVLCLGGHLLDGMDNPVVLTTLWVVYMVHGVAGLLFGLKAPSPLARHGAPTSTRRRVLMVTLIVAGLLSLVELFLPVTALSRSTAYAERGPSCRNNLRSWGLVHKMYASESEGSMFPPLSPNPGQLTPAFDEVYPRYLTGLSVVQCPDISPSLRRISYGSDFFGIAADQSYFYLGYLIDGPETLRAFHDAYQKTVAEGGQLLSDMVVTAGQGTWGSDRIPRLSDDVNVFRHHPDFDSVNPTQPAQRQSEIPIMIERPNIHKSYLRGGGNVLFMDGHVEFRRYPGAWPMTEEVMELLHAMDALGPHIPHGTSHGDRNLVGAALPFVVVLMGVGLFSLWRFGPYPAIAVPLAYVLVGIGIYVLVTILPVATPDGVVTYHVVGFENPTHGGHR